MNDRLKLISEIPPSVNHYLAYRAVIKNGRAVGMSYKTQEATQYRKRFSEYVNGEIVKQGWNREPDKFKHFYVDAVFYFDKHGMDANNYWKVLLDAITDTQAVWLDDDVVCERVNAIYYDTENPRIELDIYPVDYIGIFKDISHYETFVSRCIGCTRYARNCSILNKAKEGRIQKETDGVTCCKYKEKKEK